MNRAKKARVTSMATALREALTSDTCDMFSIDYDESNVHKWTVNMPSCTFLADNEALFKDLEAWAHEHGKPASVVMEVIFPTDYPRGPPFARIVRPRFVQRTGHVTDGGSLCTELLTQEGWTPSIGGAALLLSLHQILNDGEGRVNRFVEYDYSFAEARQAFERVARDHGWTVRGASATASSGVGQ